MRMEFNYNKKSLLDILQDPVDSEGKVLFEESILNSKAINPKESISPPRLSGKKKKKKLTKKKSKVRKFQRKKSVVRRR